MKEAIEQGDIGALLVIIEKTPQAVHQDILFGPNNEHRVHPINFICDCVFENKISESAGLEMVHKLIRHGSSKDGTIRFGRDTPLIAASSLYCDKIALFLIDIGADLHHKGTYGGTCLHWACWTGSDQVVKRLLTEEINLEDNENEFKCSPLLWAVDGLINGKGRNIRSQREVITQLLASGADPDTKDKQGNTPVRLLTAFGDKTTIKTLHQFGAKP